MSAAATARTQGTRAAGAGEHQKATYRVLVLGILALLGPAAFEMGLSGLSLLYSLVLVGYALWALRLTVIFHDDDSLGYILCVFDVLLTAPLVVWGAGSAWAIGILALVWCGGLGLSVWYQHGGWAEPHPVPSAEPAAGALGPADFRTLADDELWTAEAEGSPVALIALRVYRFEEFVACHGAPAAERATAALVRRARRIAGEGALVFRLRCDTLALLVPGCAALQAAEVAAELSRAANTRLIEGRRVDCYVGYALHRRDGGSAEGLLRSALDPGPSRSADARGAVARRSLSTDAAHREPAARTLAV